MGLAVVLFYCLLVLHLLPSALSYRTLASGYEHGKENKESLNGDLVPIMNSQPSSTNYVVRGGGGGSCGRGNLGGGSCGGSSPSSDNNGYEHENEKSTVNNVYPGQSINHMKELLNGDLVPITNHQPLSTVYVLRGGGRGGGGGGRGGGGGGGGGRGGGRGSRGGGRGKRGGIGRSSGAAGYHNGKKSAAPLTKNQNQSRLFTALGVAIVLALVLF
ncbi:hypothetical protein MKW94_009719 [Papaver nudicaule]|uniref:Glycine-rich protein n=1 Tax=Papaver nudicaule TaxID=74823 RepID=A0AA42B279_PAPNU|nr:hypothetical protein [Papaver nudicaule]